MKWELESFLSYSEFTMRKKFIVNAYISNDERSTELEYNFKQNNYKEIVQNNLGEITLFDMLSGTNMNNRVVLTTIGSLQNGIQFLVNNKINNGKWYVVNFIADSSGEKIEIGSSVYDAWRDKTKKKQNIKIYGFGLNGYIEDVFDEESGGPLTLYVMNRISKYTKLIYKVECVPSYFKDSDSEDDEESF